MTHVLLDKSLTSHLEIKGQLRRWGMTTAELDWDVPGFVWPQIQDCDLVIMGLETARSAPKESAATAGEPFEHSAPALLLGVSGPLLLDRDAWQGLPDLNPPAQDLRRAVQMCLEQNAMLRNRIGAGQDREDFLTFLGHEMRSPLTAAKTALEVLQGDMGGLENPEDDKDAGLKMVEIALRNVRRLHHTVEWSQELLSTPLFGSKNPQHDLGVDELQEFLSNKYNLRWDNVPSGALINTDLEALTQLLDQVSRAILYALPGSTLELTGKCSEKFENQLDLILHASSSPEHPNSPLVTRLGRTSGVSGETTIAAELRRLVVFIVSRDLPSDLGLDLEVLDDETQDPGIQLSIPLVQNQNRNTDEPVVQLLPGV